MLCWFSEAPLASGRRYLLRHGAKEVRAIVELVHHRLDIHTLEEAPAAHLDLNDLGRATLKLLQPLAVDPYAENRTTGAFILVDENTHATVGAGLVRSAS
jgi:sulfate adenylyltransferase subunit 1 (EFTu-like GTPase family)